MTYIYLDDYPGAIYDLDGKPSKPVGDVYSFGHPDSELYGEWHFKPGDAMIFTEPNADTPLDENDEPATWHGVYWELGGMKIVCINGHYDMALRDFEEALDYCETCKEHSEG